MARLEICIFILIFILSISGCAEILERNNSPEEHVDTDSCYIKELDNEEARLEKEKQGIFLLEGLEEEVTLKLQESLLYPYFIYIDMNRYQMEQKEGKDYIVPVMKINGKEVFLAIWYEEDACMDEIEAEVMTGLGGKYKEIFQHEGESKKEIMAFNSQNWADPVERYYLIRDFKGGVFIIQQKLFFEALEGHGVRFDRMLEEIFIWAEEENSFISLGGRE